MKPHIIYTLIAREPNIILCDYTEFSGNFQQISAILIQKLDDNSNSKIRYQKYNKNLYLIIVIGFII